MPSSPTLRLLLFILSLSYFVLILSSTISLQFQSPLLSPPLSSSKFSLLLTSTSSIPAASTLTFNYDTPTPLGYYWMMADLTDNRAPVLNPLSYPYTIYCYISPPDPQIPTQTCSTGSIPWLPRGDCNESSQDGSLLGENPLSDSFSPPIGQFSLVDPPPDNPSGPLLVFTPTMHIPAGTTINCNGRWAFYEDLNGVNPDGVTISSISPPEWSLQTPLVLKMIAPLSAYPKITTNPVKNHMYERQSGSFNVIHQFDELTLNLLSSRMPPNIISKITTEYCTADNIAQARGYSDTKWHYNEIIQSELNGYFHYTHAQGNGTRALNFYCGQDVRLFVPLFDVSIIDPIGTNPNFVSENLSQIYHKYDLYLITGSNPIPESCTIPVNLWLILRERLFFQKNWLLTPEQRLTLEFNRPIFGMVKFQGIGKYIFPWGPVSEYIKPNYNSDGSEYGTLFNFQRTRAMWLQRLEPKVEDDNIRVVTKVRASLPARKQHVMMTNIQSLTSDYIIGHLDYSGSYTQTDPEGRDPIKRLELFWNLNLNATIEVDETTHFLEIVFVFKLLKFTTKGFEQIEQFENKIKQIGILNDQIIQNDSETAIQTTIPNTVPPYSPYSPYLPFVFDFEIASIYEGVIHFLPPFIYTKGSAKYLRIETDPIPFLEFSFEAHFGPPCPLFDKIEYKNQLFLHQLSIHPIPVGMNYFVPFFNSISTCQVRHFDVNNVELTTGHYPKSKTDIKTCRLDRNDKCFSPTWNQDELKPDHVGNTFFQIHGLFLQTDSLKITCKYELTPYPKLPFTDKEGVNIIMTDKFGHQEIITEFDRSLIEPSQTINPIKYHKEVLYIDVMVKNPFLVPTSLSPEWEIGTMMMYNHLKASQISEEILSQLKSSIYTTTPTIQPISLPIELTEDDLYVNMNPECERNTGNLASTPWGDFFDKKIDHVSLKSQNGSTLSIILPLSKFPHTDVNFFQNLVIITPKNSPIFMKLRVDINTPYRKCSYSTYKTRFPSPLSPNQPHQDPSCISLIGQTCEIDADCQVMKTIDKKHIKCVSNFCTLSQLYNSVTTFTSNSQDWDALRQGLGIPYSDSLEPDDSLVIVHASPINISANGTLAFARLQCHYDKCNPIWGTEVIDISLKFPCDPIDPVTSLPLTRFKITISAYDAVSFKTIHKEAKWVRTMIPCQHCDDNQTVDRKLFVIDDVSPTYPLDFIDPVQAGSHVLLIIALDRLNVVPECPSGHQIQLYLHNLFTSGIPVLPSMVPPRVFSTSKYHPRGQFLIGPSFNPDDVNSKKHPFSNTFVFNLVLNDLIHPWKETSRLRIMPTGLSQASGITALGAKLKCSLYGQQFFTSWIEPCVDQYGNITPPPCLDKATNSKYFEWKMSKLGILSFEQSTMEFNCQAEFDFKNHQAVANSFKNSLFGFVLLGYDEECGDSNPALHCSRSFVSSIDNDLDLIPFDEVVEVNRNYNYLQQPKLLDYRYLRYIPATTGDLEHHYEIVAEHVYITSYIYYDPVLSNSKSPFKTPPQSLLNTTLFSFTVLGQAIETSQREEDKGKLGSYFVYCVGYVPTKETWPYGPKKPHMKQYALISGDLVLYERLHNDQNAVRLRLEARNEKIHDVLSYIPEGTICNQYHLTVQNYFFSNYLTIPNPKKAISVTSTLEYTQDLDTGPDEVNFSTVVQTRYVANNETSLRSVRNSLYVLKVIHWCDETRHFNEINKEQYFGWEFNFRHGLQHALRAKNHLEKRWERRNGITITEKASYISTETSFIVTLHKTEWVFGIDHTIEPFHSARRLARNNWDSPFFGMDMKAFKEWQKNHSQKVQANSSAKLHQVDDLDVEYIPNDVQTSSNENNHNTSRICSVKYSKKKTHDGQNNHNDKNQNGEKDDIPYPHISDTITTCAIWIKGDYSSVMYLPAKLNSSNILSIGYFRREDYTEWEILKDQDIENAFSRTSSTSTTLPPITPRENIRFNLEKTYVWHCSGLFAEFIHVSQNNPNYSEYDQDLKSPPLLTLTYGDYNSTYHTYIWDELPPSRYNVIIGFIIDNADHFWFAFLCLLVVFFVIFIFTIILWWFDTLEKCFPTLSDNYDSISLSIEARLCPSRLARQLQLPRQFEAEMSFYILHEDH